GRGGGGPGRRPRPRGGLKKGQPLPLGGAGKFTSPPAKQKRAAPTTPPKTPPATTRDSSDNENAARLNTRLTRAEGTASSSTPMETSLQMVATHNHAVLWTAS